MKAAGIESIEKKSNTPTERLIQSHLEFRQRFENAIVTPEKAKDLLEHNYEGQRNIRQSYVEQLAHVMQAGRYVSQNGQTLVVGMDDGILYDGQHRLAAVVLSGMTQIFGIAYILDGKEAYKTIDNGTRRQASDYLVNMPSRNNCAAVSKVMACVEWGSAPLRSCLQGKWLGNTQVDRGLIVTFATQNAERVVDAVRRAQIMRKAIKMGPLSLYAKFILLVQFCQTDDCLGAFLGDFSKTAPQNPTVTALKTALMQKLGNSSNYPGDKWMLGILLDGYTHFSEQDASTMLNKQNLRLNQYQELVEAARKGGGDHGNESK